MTRMVIYSADPWDSAISYLRIREPAYYLGWELIPAKTDSGIDTHIAKDADYIIIQRDFPRFVQCNEIIQIAKQKGIPLIYEIDDCIFYTPDPNKQYEAYRYYLNGILNTIIAADRVIISSKFLYRQLINFNKHVFLFPNYLPENIWKIKSLEIDNSENLTIGYMGGNTHYQDLEWVTPVLIKILEQNKNVSIKIWGCHPPQQLLDQPEVQYLAIDFQDYPQFAEYFQNQTCDVFIAPLLDSPFNQGKSGIKFLEYSALGIPGVYKRLDPYIDYVVDGENGYLAGGLDEWYEKIMSLLSDSNIRHRFAENAQITVRQHVMSKHFREWETAINGSSIQTEIVDDMAHDNNPLDLIQHISIDTQKAIWDIQNIIASLKQENHDLENENLGLKEHLDNVLNSQTWKIAKIIQSILRIFKFQKE